jgi:hypothetical protein
MIQILKFLKNQRANMSLGATTVTLAQIKDIIQQYTESELLLPALHPIELEAFVSGLISFYGLAAVNRASAMRAADPATDLAAIMETSHTFDSLSTDWTPRLNFDGASRDDLLGHLESCCGLERALCGRILANLEEWISVSIYTGKTVFIGGILSIQPVGNGRCRLKYID